MACMTFELGILGAGNMAEAIVRGVLSRHIFEPHQIIAADPIEQRRKVFEQLGVATTDDNATAAKDARTLLLSTKPYQLMEALRPVGNVLPEQTLIISIAAGVTTGGISAALGHAKKWRIVRAMPNTPMLVGLGAVGIAPGASASPADLLAARKIFESAASVVEVREDQIDAVTALSGSGPAYFYYLVEAMIRAGVEMGLGESASKELAIKTCLGAANLLVQSNDSPADLRKKVTTPGGTTHAAISYMDAHDFTEIIVGALKAAEQRGKELGK